MTGNPNIEDEAMINEAWEIALKLGMVRAQYDRPDLDGTVGMFVAANDYAGMIRAKTRLINMHPKPEPKECIRWVGSYARMDWLQELITLTGRMKWPASWWIKDVYPDLCDHWSSADPDDTVVAWLNMFAQARALNGAPLHDGTPLGQTGATISVWRGEPGDPRIPYTNYVGGLSWTTNPIIAHKFATGATSRGSIDHGTLWSGYVTDTEPLAFITGRGESELIIPPEKVTLTTHGTVFAATPNALPDMIQCVPFNPIPLTKRTHK